MSIVNSGRKRRVARGQLNIAQDDVYSVFQKILEKLSMIEIHLSLLTDANISEKDVE